MKHAGRTLAIALCAAVAMQGLCGCTTRGEMCVEQETDPIVLSFFMPMGEQKNEGSNVFLKLIDQYNASHDDVQIQVEGLSIKDGYNEVLEKRLASGQGDDLFAINADSVKSFAASGYLCDLADLPACSRLYPAAREQAEIDGLVYTIPLTMAAYGMYVNTDLLEKYGLAPPEDYPSWMHCCQVLKENGVTPFAVNRWYAMTVPVMARGLYKLYQSDRYGELAEGLNDGSIPIGDYMLEGFQMFETFLEQEYYGDDLTREGVDSIPACTTDLQAFQEQTVAFAFFSTGVEKYFDDEGGGDALSGAGGARPSGRGGLPALHRRPTLCQRQQQPPEGGAGGGGVHERRHCRRTVDRRRGRPALARGAGGDADGRRAHAEAAAPGQPGGTDPHRGHEPALHLLGHHPHPLPGDDRRSLGRRGGGEVQRHPTGTDWPVRGRISALERAQTTCLALSDCVLKGPTALWRAQKGPWDRGSLVFSLCIRGGGDLSAGALWRCRLSNCSPWRRSPALHRCAEG